MFYINIVIINVIVLVALSYYWSFWTHRLFKPWLWQERRRSKLLPGGVEAAERASRDKVRYYAHFFALEQLERQEVPGGIALLGLEQTQPMTLCQALCPARPFTVVAPFEASQVTLRHENCQGEVSEETLNVDFVPLDDAQRLFVQRPGCQLVQGRVDDNLQQVLGPLAFVGFDLVEHDTVLAALRHVYPLLQPGGILFVHAYNHSWPGVTAAVNEFQASIPERFLPLPDQYGSVALIKNAQGNR